MKSYCYGDDWDGDNCPHPYQHDGGFMLNYDVDMWLHRCAHWMLAHGTVNEYNCYGWDNREEWLSDMRAGGL